jgi:hypothetical protein
MTDTTTETMLEPRPYKPSWIDDFTRWVENLSTRAWIFYVAFGIALILIQILFQYLDGGLQATELLPVIIFNGFAVPFLLALIHLLDHQAMTAANAMRPILDMSDTELDQYEYRLANMPFLPPLILGVILVMVTILAPLVAIEPIRYATLEGRPLFAVVFHIIDKSSAFLMGVFLYHTVRQLRLVSAINLNHLRINLFRLGPLQAFSRLTATTAVGIMAFVYLWMFINPELLTDPVNLGLAALFMIFAVSLFVWPLYGVHRLMVTEKEKTLRDLDERFEEVFSKFNQRFQEEDSAALERLNGIIASLDVQHRRMEAIPTWPWSSQTAQFVLTAIALPLLLMVIGFLVEQAMGL